MISGTDPIAVFQAAAEAVAREEWLAAAVLCDPISLRLFKDELVQRVSPDREIYPVSVEALLRSQPDMPRDVAEYQVAQHERSWNQSAVLEREVPGVGDITSLRALSPVEVFAAHLSRNSVDNRIKQLRQFTPMTTEWEELVRSQVQAVPRYSALGVIHESERIAFVVFRLDFRTPGDDIAAANGSGDPDAGLSAEKREYVADVASGPPECQTCRRQPDGSWRLVAGHHFLGLGNIAFAFGYDEGEQGTESDV